MDKYKKHACDFKSEAECEEELDEEDTDLSKEEAKHFEDNEEELKEFC